MKHYVIGTIKNNGKYDRFSGGQTLKDVENGIRFHLENSTYDANALFKEIRSELIATGHTSFASSQKGFEGMLFFATECSKFNPHR